MHNQFTKICSPLKEIHTFCSLCFGLFLLVLLFADVTQADEYSIIISTANPTSSGYWEGTRASVHIDIGGNEGAIPTFQLENPIGRRRTGNAFVAGRSNWYKVTRPGVGIICQVWLSLHGRYSGDTWHINTISVINKNNSQGAVFVIDQAISDTETAKHNLPVHGRWGTWAKWSLCKGSCDQYGSKFRLRSCDAPKPGCGGRECVGEKREKRKCRVKPCPTTATISGIETVTTEGSVMTATKCDNSVVVSIGVVLALSIVLNIILALFLFVVLRNVYSDRKDSQDQSKR